MIVPALSRYMFRGYDTSALFREDTIERIRHLNAEIAKVQKSIEEMEKETAVREERIQKLKKEIGFTDSPKSQITDRSINVIC